jgi:hypothetical protein
MHLLRVQLQTFGKFLYHVVCGCVAFYGAVCPALSAETSSNLIVDYRHGESGSYAPLAISLPDSERAKIADLVAAMLEIYKEPGACAFIVTYTDSREAAQDERLSAVRERLNYLKVLLVRLGVEPGNISNPVSLELQASYPLQQPTMPDYSVEFYSCVFKR